MKIAPVVVTTRFHWPLLILAAVSAVLIFTNLGRDYLWEDEGDTAVLASNVLKFGVPKAWDGAAFIDSDHGARVNGDLVMVTHPWVQYYLTACSFVIFGQNTWAARFPFALASWMSILFVYFFVWRSLKNRMTAFCAAALLVLSVQFLLFARQCRYCSLNMFLIIWVVWEFFKMKSARDCALFVLAATLLFHTHPYGLAPVVALGALSFFHRELKTQRRFMWFAAPSIALLTVPWIALATLFSTGAAINTSTPQTVGGFFERCGQAFIEATSVTPLIGAGVILLSAALTHWRRKNSEGPAQPFVTSGEFLDANESSILLALVGAIVLYGFATAMTQSTDALWLAGMRFASPVLPLAAIAAAMIIVKASRGNILVCVALLLVFGFTKVAQLTPWLAWNSAGVIRCGKYSVGTHVPVRVIDRVLGSGMVKYIRDLWHENSGTIATTCKFLRANSKPGDVLILNYGWEPTYFYTRLPQALNILPNYPVYQRARELGLPEFVFDIDRARWIVWRSAWETAPGYAMDDVAREIVRRGGKITVVLEIEETVFENSPDIHLHRFSDGTYLFPRTQTFPPSRIGRVDWPDR